VATPRAGGGHGKLAAAARNLLPATRQRWHDAGCTAHHAHPPRRMCNTPPLTLHARGLQRRRGGALEDAKPARRRQGQYLHRAPGLIRVQGHRCHSLRRQASQRRQPGRTASHPCTSGSWPRRSGRGRPSGGGRRCARGGRVAGGLHALPAKFGTCKNANTVQVAPTEIPYRPRRSNHHAALNCGSPYGKASSWRSEPPVGGGARDSRTGARGRVRGERVATVACCVAAEATALRTRTLPSQPVAVTRRHRHHHAGGARGGGGRRTAGAWAGRTLTRQSRDPTGKGEGRG